MTRNEMAEAILEYQRAWTCGDRTERRIRCTAINNALATKGFAVVQHITDRSEFAILNLKTGRHSRIDVSIYN